MTDMLLGALFGLAALLLALFSRRALARWKCVRDTPTVPIGRLTPGMVGVFGRIAESDRHCVSPMTQKTCVYYRFTVDAMRRLSRTRTWRTVVSDKKWSPCWIEDGTGRIEVDFASAEIFLRPDVTVRSGFLNDPPARLKQLLADRYQTSTESWGLNRKLRFRETVLEFGEQLYVLGLVVSGEDTPRLASGGPLFVVSDEGKQAVVQRFFWIAMGLIALSVAAAAGSVSFLL